MDGVRGSDGGRWKTEFACQGQKKEKEQEKKEGDTYEWRVLEKDKVRKIERGWKRDCQSENSRELGMMEQRKRPPPELKLKVKLRQNKQIEKKKKNLIDLRL